MTYINASIFLFTFQFFCFYKSDIFLCISICLYLLYTLLGNRLFISAVCLLSPPFCIYSIITFREVSSVAKKFCFIAPDGILSCKSVKRERTAEPSFFAKYINLQPERLAVGDELRSAAFQSVEDPAQKTPLVAQIQFERVPPDKKYFSLLIIRQEGKFFDQIKDLGAGIMAGRPIVHERLGNVKAEAVARCARIADPAAADEGHDAPII